MRGQPVVILITAPSIEEAKSMSRHLVEKGLAACVNIVSGVQSLFVWNGKFCQEDEVLLIAKSVREKVKEIVAAVKEMHSYDVPEIIVLPIVDGSKDYLDWLQESVSSNSTAGPLDEEAGNA
jgi:periplasmic divalent cation tolerance protein